MKTVLFDLLAALLVTFGAACGGRGVMVFTQKHTPKSIDIQQFSDELKFAAIECNFRAVNRLLIH